MFSINKVLVVAHTGSRRASSLFSLSNTYIHTHKQTSPTLRIKSGRCGLDLRVITTKQGRFNAKLNLKFDLLWLLAGVGSQRRFNLDYQSGRSDDFLAPSTATKDHSHLLWVSLSE
jgi:hypothetical protein